MAVVVGCQSLTVRPAVFGREWIRLEDPGSSCDIGSEQCALFSSAAAALSVLSPRLLSRLLKALERIGSSTHWPVCSLPIAIP